MNSEFTRVKYLNRELQISVEKKEMLLAKIRYLMIQLYYQIVLLNMYLTIIKNTFFKFYGPFKDCEVIKAMREYLVGRMIMIGL